MNKKLPGVYQNKITKKIGNNESVVYGAKEEEKVVEEIRSSDSLDQSLDVNQKIRNIFNSIRYIYKADVKIKLKNGEVIKKIIGRNNKNIITLDNELIAIDEIEDIDFA